MLKRKIIILAILGALPTLVSAQAHSSVFCTNNPRDSGYLGPVDCDAAGVAVASPANRSGSVRLGFYGSQGQGKPDATVRISGTTRAFSVAHLATVKIENDKGQSFVWRFDSDMAASAIPLKTIAPSGFDAGDTWVTVAHPGEHFGG